MPSSTGPVGHMGSTLCLVLLSLEVSEGAVSEPLCDPHVDKFAAALVEPQRGTSVFHADD